jgi:hypothetical protein
LEGGGAMAFYIPALPQADFVRCCRDHFDEYFTTFGFPPLNKVDATYTDGYVFCDFSFWADGCWPNCLLVEVGIVPKSGFAPDCGVALANVIPQADASAQYEDWTFKNEVELNGCLDRMHTAVLPRYAIPLLRNPDGIKALIRRWVNEQEAKQEAKRVERIRNEAIAAFKSGFFAESFQLYQQISVIDLYPSDAMRIGICRKRVFGRAD